MSSQMTFEKFLHVFMSCKTWCNSSYTEQALIFICVAHMQGSGDGDTGLFCGNTGLFCGKRCLLCGNIGRFCGNMGLFCISTCMMDLRACCWKLLHIHIHTHTNVYTHTCMIGSCMRCCNAAASIPTCAARI